MRLTIAPILYTSFIAILKIFAVSAVGFLSAIYPKDNPVIPKDSLKTLSRLSNMVFLPATIISILGSTLSVPILSNLSILVVFAFIINTVSYSLIYTLGKLFYDGDNVLFTAIAVAVGSPNAISFPILVMETMCEQNNINIDYGGDSSKCRNEALSMVFVYSIGWHIMFWTFGFPVIGSMNQTQDNQLFIREPTFNESLVLIRDYLKTEGGKDELFKWLHSVLLSPAMLSIYVGIFIGLIPALQNVFFKNGAPLYVFGSVLATLGQPLVCINTLLMSCSLGHADWKNHSIIKSTEQITKSPLHKDETLEFDGENLTAFKQNMDNNKIGSIPNYKSILIHALCRLLLPPLIIIPILNLVQAIGFIGPHQRLLKLVIGIESCAPSAQLVIISLNQLGIQSIASNMAYMYLFHYLIAMFTLSMWAAVYISIVYT